MQRKPLIVAALALALALGAGAVWLARQPVSGAVEIGPASVPVPASASASGGQAAGSTSAAGPTSGPGDALPAGEALAVPSGQAVRYLDTIQGAPGAEGLTIRFRFLAPAISRQGGTVNAETAQGDMLALCQSYALPRLPATGPQPEQIIISLSDRPVPFGETDEEATQFFEAYSIAGDQCVWEVF